MSSHERIAPPRAGATAWLETFGLTLAVAALGYWSEPLDPLKAFAGFPWTLFAPLLMGLRYGFAQGFVSALLLLANMTWLHYTDYGDYKEIPLGYMVGLLAVAMISGEFRDLWERRLEGLQRTNDYRQMRLDEFTRAHHILRISHERMEQRLAGSDQSLRSVLLAMRKQLGELESAADPLEDMAAAILDLFGHYGPVRQGALYRVRDGQMVGAALAAVGETEAVDPQDPLVQLALQRAELISVRPELIEQGAGISGSTLLAVIPLLDTGGVIHALVLVRQMPFFAFNDRNLNLLAILGGHVADLLARNGLSQLQQDVDAPQFSRLCRRALHDARQYDVPGCVVGVEFKDQAWAQDVERLLLAQQRALDVTLLMRNRRGHAMVLLLLPLTTEAGFAGYLERIRQVVVEALGVDLDETGVDIHVHFISRRNGTRRLQQFFDQECELDEPQLAVR